MGGAFQEFRRIHDPTPLRLPQPIHLSRVIRTLIIQNLLYSEF